MRARFNLVASINPPIEPCNYCFKPIARYLYYSHDIGSIIPVCKECSKIYVWEDLAEK